MDPNQNTNHRKIQSVDKAFRIVEALRKLDGAGVTEVADYVDMTKGSAHTYLYTLKENGIVSEVNGKYKLGFQLLNLGEFTKRQSEVYQCSRQQLEEMAERTGELARLVVKEQGYGVYISKSEGDNAIETTVLPGQREHLHCTSQGKAILASLPDEKVHAIIDEHGLPAKTPDTITDTAELFDELEQIRERGIAFSRSEVTRGMRCVAAPIHAPSGTVTAAIGICGPASRMKGERFREELPEVVSNAANIVEINIQMSESPS